MTDARAGRVALKVLSQPNPEARVGRVALKVLGRSVAVGTLSAVMPPITGAFVGDYEDPPTLTDVSNNAGARRRGGIGHVTVTTAVAPAPPGVSLAPRVDAAVPLPTPTMVDGRPT